MGLIKEFLSKTWGLLLALLGIGIVVLEHDKIKQVEDALTVAKEGNEEAALKQKQADIKAQETTTTTDADAAKKQVANENANQVAQDLNKI